MINLGGFKPQPKPVKRDKKAKKPLRQVSRKREAQDREYAKLRPKFLAGKYCAVYHDRKAVQVHHMKGRDGYADDWARNHGVSLYLDQRFWLPVSDEGHKKIEANPVWAKEKGFSQDRLS